MAFCHIDTKKWNKNMITVLQVARMNKGSGVASFLMNYYRYIDKSKINFLFLSDELWENENYKEEIEQFGGKIFITGKYKNIVHYIKSICKILRDNKIDIIHCHEATISLIALFIAKKYKIPVRIAHSHNSKMPSFLKDLIVKVTRPLFRIFATNYFACSTEAGKYLFGDVKTTVINNAVVYDSFSFDSSKRDFLRKAYNIDKKFVVGTVGRFNYQKNYPFLLELFSKVHDQNKDAVLVICGDGELRKEIESDIIRHNLEASVLLLGNISNVNEVLNAFDCFVLASHYEGLPVVLIEAQTNGLTCIASSSAVPKVCNIKDHLLFMNGYNVDEWKETIQKISERHNLQLNELKEAGYEINTETKFLETTYYNLLK